MFFFAWESPVFRMSWTIIQEQVSALPVFPNISLPVAYELLPYSVDRAKNIISRIKYNEDISFDSTDGFFLSGLVYST
jgi:hypothetical protein